jgi:predicted AAA+ superfamily ATPase
MDNLFFAFYQQLARIDTSFVRYLYGQIDWANRLIGITGARGAGKTTMLLQHIRKIFGKSPKEVLFASLDNIWFTNNRLFELGADFVKQGGKYLFLDEVHKYPSWSQEIKNLYDSFPDLKIVFTGSSMLEIYKGNADLSRRAIHYTLQGMSFREYLLMEKGILFPSVTLKELINNHLELATQVNEKIRPIPCFQSYLKEGYYPYYKESKSFYNDKLLQTVNIVLESDLPALEKIEIYSIQKIKKLLMVIAQRVPFTPNISELASLLEVSRNSLLNYLTLLEKAQLINLLNQDVSGLRTLSKPEKIYLNNTNLVHALETEKPDIGNLRETFFFNQIRVVSSVASSQKTDFTVNGGYQFEVGGKNKGHEQITGLDNAYLALDNLEYGFGNKIPLWLFGFLY